MWQWRRRKEEKEEERQNQRGQGWGRHGVRQFKWKKRFKIVHACFNDYLNNKTYFVFSVDKELLSRKWKHEEYDDDDKIDNESTTKKKKKHEKDM